MDILHVGKYYPPHMGGTEIYTRELVRRHSAAAAVTVIVANDRFHESREQMDNATIIRVPRYGVIASMPVTPTLSSYIRSVPADIVHLHMPNPAAAAAYLLSGHRGQLILTHHADTVGRRLLRTLSDPVVKKVMGRASSIIVTTRKYLETSIELAEFTSKCKVISLGINASRFSSIPEDNVQAITDMYGPRLLLCIGRLVRFKGFEYAIRAMTRLDATLLIVGEGGYEETLRRIAIECGVRDRVHFLGSLPNERIPALLKSCSVLLFPSTARTESFGYVQLEAMASGLPVINTSIESGASEISLNEVTGLTVPPGDVEALIIATNRLLNDDALRSRFGAAGKRRVAQNFTLDRMAEATLQLYNEVYESATYRV